MTLSFRCCVRCINRYYSCERDFNVSMVAPGALAGPRTEKLDRVLGNSQTPRPDAVQRRAQLSVPGNAFGIPAAQSAWGQSAEPPGSSTRLGQQNNAFHGWVQENGLADMLAEVAEVTAADLAGFKHVDPGARALLARASESAQQARYLRRTVQHACPVPQ
jgi:hypothetical protein